MSSNYQSDIFLSNVARSNDIAKTTVDLLEFIRSQFNEKIIYISVATRNVQGFKDSCHAYLRFDSDHEVMIRKINTFEKYKGFWLCATYAKAPFNEEQVHRSEKNFQNYLVSLGSSDVGDSAESSDEMKETEHKSDQKSDRIRNQIHFFLTIACLRLTSPFDYLNSIIS
jgi:hypothetical protein